MHGFSDHHDACGVGFIADRRRRASHWLLRRGVECLVRLDHRGAKSADGTGDGAGLMTSLPYRLLQRELAGAGLDPIPEERLGVVMGFFPQAGTGEVMAAINDALAAEGLAPRLWRKVPMNPGVLSERARREVPDVRQALVDCPVPDAEELERRLFLARKRVEGELEGLEGFSISSASGRTVVYKGLFTASHIDDFYWDLRDVDFETTFAIFHQRYSTNTKPDWHMAQPFRLVAHNGEINTVNSNRAWMAAREVNVTSPLWGERAGDLAPFLQRGLSDSGSFDNALELLVRSGRGLVHAKEMLVPAAWENLRDLDPSLRAFYEYHAFLTEPWDGPAALAASDGRTVLAAMDRNGLRPARWTVTHSAVLVASEAGVCPEVEAEAQQTGQLGPGELLAFDLGSGEISHSAEAKNDLAALQPYSRWIRNETLYVQDPFDDLQDDRFDPAGHARAFGYTAEERRLVIQEMAEGRSPTGSMGTDTPLAALSHHPRRLSHFFHQMFAQVTNPPMDPIREKLVMSLRTYLGARGSLLEETEQQAHLIELASPILSDAELEEIVRTSDPRFFSDWLPVVFPAAEGRAGFRRRLDELLDEAVDAVRGGASIVVLSDREVDEEMAPLPMLLAVGAVHHRLIAEGLRMKASIVAVSAEPRDAHDLACLVAYGASAVNPYLGIEQARSLAADGAVGFDPVVAQENYRQALQHGLLKIMSKMGISTVSAYRGSELFEVIGLDDDLCRLAFAFTPRRVGGLGMDDIADRALAQHARYGADEPLADGFYKHRRGGEAHVTSPSVVLSLQKAVRAGTQEAWDVYREAIEDRGPALIRDLWTLKTNHRREDVEPAEQIMRRFVTAAMSHGALSKEAHEALAEAMSLIGGLSNSGEGGEDPDRFDSPRNSGIKQVASGRFGVTPAYLASAEELQIKMAQGSKPGEGGQLPGHKVSVEIARLRHTEPGVTLISPPPHHDIYSIEDLAQLIYDLKAFNPRARVSVKLVSEPGVGTIAVGVAKAQADAILISGAEGGTGASPLVSIKHAGSPWELGLAEAHQALLAHGLRDRVILETDGGLRTGKDVVIAAMLGAERFGFGTLPLLALGCKMVRQCHENTCPVGIATQREDLRAKFSGAADQVVVLFRLLSEEVRHWLGHLGARTLSEIIGRADLLTTIDDPVAATTAPFLVRASGRSRHPGFIRPERSALAARLIEESAHAVATGDPVELAYPINNADRTIGAGVSGEVALRRNEGGLPPGTIKIRLAGSAGQSFGAFLTNGVSLDLAGAANDYVGKGMGGGDVVVNPRALMQFHDGSVPHAAGNAVLYGATGGTMLIAGAVGQRFAVRNSGARAVVEGCSDHGCEYMTGGTVVVAGRIGRNFGAGMTGGVAYVYDPDRSAPALVADTAPALQRLSGDEISAVAALLEAHAEATSSPVTRGLLAELEATSDAWWVLRASGSPASPEAEEASQQRGAPAVDVPASDRPASGGSPAEVVATR